MPGFTLKNRRFFCAALFLFVALAGCNRQQQTAWDLLPPATAVVWENATLASISEQPLHFQFSKNFRFDSLQIPCFIAWVVVEKDKLEPFVTAARQALDADKIFRTAGSPPPERRKFNGLEFVVYKTPNSRVAVLQVDGLVVFSENPLVIESVIRTVAQKAANRRLPSLRKLPNRKKDQGTLYVDWNLLGTPFPLGGTSILDVQLGNNELVLDGFTLPDTARSSFHLLSLMASQKPVPITLHNAVPQGATHFLHLGVSNPAAWQESHRQLLARKRPDILDSLRLLEAATGFSRERFFDAIDGEVGFVATARGNLILIKLKEISKAAGELRKLQTLAAPGPDEPGMLFLERGHFVHQMFWPLAAVFSEVHYAYEDNVLFLSDTQPAIQYALERVRIDQTWGRTLAWKRAHPAMLDEANISYFYSASGSVQFLSPGVALTGGYAQFSNIDQQFYTSLVLRVTPGALRGALPDTAGRRDKPAHQIFLNNAIQSAAYPVVNHTSGDEEIILADVAGNLHLISNHKSLWTLPVGELQSPVFQIDYFRNKKLQYVFLAGGKLFVVDRLGRRVTGFPVAVPPGRTTGFEVVDYDQSRNYRFLVLHEAGNAFLLNSSGQPLEGWNPCRFPERIQKIGFQRLRGKDYFVAVAQRKLYLTNRRGEVMPGFPVDMREDVYAGFHADVPKGTFVVLTTSGRRLSVRPDGTIADEYILPKNSVEAAFFILQNTSKLYIGRLDRGKVAVFDERNQLLFEAENPGSNRLAGQVAGEDARAFVFYDEEQQLAFALSSKGAQLLPGPLESSGVPRVSAHAGGRLNLYTVQRANLLITPLN